MAETAKQTIQLDLVAKIDDFKKTIASVPGVTKKEATKAARLMEKAFKDATKEVGKDTKKGLGEGFESAAEAIGGPVGEATQKLKHLSAAFTALSSPAGIAAAAAAGVTLAVGGFAAASVGAVLAADELAAELEGLSEIPGFEPLPPSVVAQIETANGAVAALSSEAKQATLIFASEMAPAVSTVLELLARLGLVALDAFSAFAEGKNITRELAVFFVDELVDAIAAPIDWVTRLAGVFGDLAGALGQDEIAGKLQSVRDTWEGFSRGVAETAVDFWIGAAVDGVNALDTATAEYAGRSQELIQTQIALSNAEGDRAEKADDAQKKQLENLKLLNTWADATKDLSADLEGAGEDLAAAFSGLDTEFSSMIEDWHAEIKSAAMGAAQDLAGAVSSVFGEALNQSLDQVGSTQSALQDLGEDASAAERQALLSQLEAQKEQALKLFKAEKTAGISSALINGAVAVTQALAQLGPIAGGIAAAGIAATTATQVGIIAAQPAPEFHQGGLVGDPSEVPAVLRRGEGVLTTQGARAAGGESGIRALNQGQPAGGRQVVELRVGVQTTERQILQAVGASSQVRRTLSALSPSAGRVNPYTRG